MRIGHIRDELEQWPGASIVGVTIGRKHHRLTVAFGGRQRFVMLSGSPSDRCAENNQIRDVRKVLAELGAARNARRKAVQRRERNRPDRTLPSSAGRAPVKENPFAVLAQIQFSEPPRKGHLRGALRLLAGSVRRMVARWRKPCARSTPTPSKDRRVAG